MVAAVAALLYVLVRPFITDPHGARTVADEPRTTTTESQGRPPLADALLTLADLPTGWSAQADPGGPRTGFCGGRNPLAVVIPAEELHATFSKTTNGPFVSELALRYGSEDEAEQLMGLVEDTFESCRSYDENGGSLTLEPLDFVGLGNDTFAAHVTGQTSIGPLAGDVVWVRKGNRVVSLATIAFSDLDGNLVSDVDLIELLTEAVVDRL
jgi:hypothetical protein